MTFTPAQQPQHDPYNAEMSVMFDTLEDEYLADLIADHVFLKVDEAFTAYDYQTLRHFYYEFAPKPLGPFAMALEVSRRLFGGRQRAAYERPEQADAQ